MYVTTFYSYKGGVGRTMALSNIAYLLAKDGKRVLIVDFDLEAPGLSTYEPFTCAKASSGVVEYVSDFISTNVAPRAEDFIIPCQVNEYTIWLMPAGDFTCTNYNQRLHEINWKRLYAEQSGFLLMEDLKQQWAEFEGQGFDYVLIDSRTGHTDVGGICTRQLPDSVVVMFVPTPQNIEGLKPIVKSIRKEKAPVRKRKVSLHFCPSNVPDLDDEELILSSLIDKAREELVYDENAGLIHHYQSLDLLSQPIYAASHPNSRLARQYDELKTSIIAGNLGDRDGALISIKQMVALYKQAGPSLEREQLDTIATNASFIRNSYPQDPEIAFGLAVLANAMVKPEEEMAALNTIIDHGEEPHWALMRRAIARTTLDDREGAVKDLKAVLLEGSASVTTAKSAQDLLTVFASDEWRAVTESAILREGLDSIVKSALIEPLLSSHSEAYRVAELTRHALDLAVDNREMLRTMIVLSLISASEFSEAMREIGHRNDVLASTRINDVFNYAIAEWASSESIPKDLFERVISLAGEMKVSGPNVLQCVALCKGAVGFIDEALDDIAAAERRIEHGSSVFSCWRYLSVTGSEMVDDLHDMKTLIQMGRPPAPPFHLWKVSH